MAIVTVKDLKKKYGQVKAVDGISFSIKKGEVFGLLGPNGAGKTSTINMMIGLSRPSSGHIIIDGYDAIKETKKVQKLIGIVPDSNNLYDEMSGFDNLCFAPPYMEWAKEREKKSSPIIGPIRFKPCRKSTLQNLFKGYEAKAYNSCWNHT